MTVPRVTWRSPGLLGRAPLSRSGRGRGEAQPLSGPQWGGLDSGSGPRGLASSPLGNPPHSVTVPVSLALLCETRGVDWMSSEGPSSTVPLCPPIRSPKVTQMQTCIHKFKHRHPGAWQARPERSALGRQAARKAGSEDGRQAHWGCSL